MSLPDFLREIKTRLRPRAELGNVELVDLNAAGEPIHLPLWRRLFLALVIILVATLSFGIGRLSVVGNREPIKIEYDPELAAGNPAQVINKAQTASALNAVGQSVPGGLIGGSGGLTGSAVVVSKNGSKYHYAHCSGAKQIKEENKIVFNTAEAAEAAGYTLAANCMPR